MTDAKRRAKIVEGLRQCLRGRRDQLRCMRHYRGKIGGLFTPVRFNAARDAIALRAAIRELQR